MRVKRDERERERRAALNEIDILFSHRWAGRGGRENPD